MAYNQLQKSLDILLRISDNTRQVLVYVLKQIVVLLHPFVPFISEEIYQAIPGVDSSINLASWPNIPSKYLDEEIAKEMDSIIEVITNVRNVRNTENIANSIKLKISVTIAFVFSSIINSSFIISLLDVSCAKIPA